MRSTQKLIPCVAIRALELATALVGSHREVQTHAIGVKRLLVEVHRFSVYGYVNRFAVNVYVLWPTEVNTPT